MMPKYVTDITAKCTQCENTTFQTIDIEDIGHGVGSVIAVRCLHKCEGMTTPHKLLAVNIRPAF